MKKQIIKALKNTKLEDLKVGDIVITAELHKVVEIEGEDWISVVGVNPDCDYCKKHKIKCKHSYIKHIGYGQQGILKVVKK